VPDVHDLLGQAQRRCPVDDALESHETDVSQRTGKPGTGLTVVLIDTNAIDQLTKTTVSPWRRSIN